MLASSTLSKKVRKNDERTTFQARLRYTNMPEDLDSLLRDREAELVRLRAEIGRLRSALTQSDKLHASSSEEVASLTQQLHQAATLNKQVRGLGGVTCSACMHACM